MSDEWDVEAVRPNLESMLKNISPYRVDKKAEERLAKCVKATSRRFECPGCGIPKHLEPFYSGEEWHYWGQCSHCGAKWCNAYRIMIKCTECGKKNPITSKNPDGRCKCQAEARGDF